ncbi:uncharacterized protein LOC129747676 [Uranotaenia lowii]|uniref:uncharacterized protein LOC129747676 n=1 Tax=Uranotaenia lowii TaxID=190385 RepID=UPI00247AC360|nr:uncharacterized protein LOC129747676 [Uranotaenia lowii]
MSEKIEACLSCNHPQASGNPFLVCSVCSQECCLKCYREPSEMVSIFSSPVILCRSCFRAKQEVADSNTNCCPFHPGRFKDLYCVTCSVFICCDCFLQQADHKRHAIDSAEVVYKDKLMETVENFRKIPEKLQAMSCSASRQLDENLNIIQDVERQIMLEVHGLFQSGLADTMRKTEEKKKTLLKTKELVQQIENQYRQTVELIQKMKTADILRTQEALNKRCEQLLKDCDSLQVAPVRWDDLKCDLIPVCKLQRIVLNIPQDTPPEGITVPTIILYDESGIQWKTVFHISPQAVYLEMAPNMLLNEFRFKAVVEISHATHLKVVGKSFSFLSTLARNELISMETLNNCGFLTDARDLMLRVGIRAESIVEENDLLRMLLTCQRKATDALTGLKKHNFVLQSDILRLRCEIDHLRAVSQEQISTLQKNNTELKLKAEEVQTSGSSSSGEGGTPTKQDFYKQNLLLDMRRLQAKLETMKITMKSMNPFAIGSFEIYRWSKESKFYSPQLTTYNGITIYVIVQPNFGNEKDCAVNGYVCWAKGPKKECEVFMEVVNESEQDSAREERMFDFSKGSSFYWKSIISHYVLYRNGGFLGDDNLKIKFGVRPLVN